MLRRIVYRQESHLWSLGELFPWRVNDDKVELHGIDGELHAPGEVLQRPCQERLLDRHQEKTNRCRCTGQKKLGHAGKGGGSIRPCCSCMSRRALIVSYSSHSRLTCSSVFLFSSTGLLAPQPMNGSPGELWQEHDPTHRPRLCVPCTTPC